MIVKSIVPLTCMCITSPKGINAQPPGPNAWFSILRYLISGMYIKPAQNTNLIIYMHTQYSAAVLGSQLCRL